MRRNSYLPRLSKEIASTAAALATCCSLISHAQQPALPVPPPVTAVGSPEIIQTAMRPFRSAIAARMNQSAAPAHATPPNTAYPNPFPAAPASSAPAAQTPPNPLPAQANPATTGAEQFRSQLDLAIEVSSRRYLTANSHSPWQIFHGLLALKKDFQLILGDRKVNAIEWIATSEPRFDNQPLLMKTQFGGKFHSFTRPYAFEGHPAQFVALLSQSDLPIGYSFKVGSEQITLGDIINNTMKEVNTREEVTWVLWGLQHYLKTDTQWVNQHNEPWSIERLVQIETTQPVVGTPCGGNHRLFALTRTRDKHLRTGGKLVGVWAQADHRIRQHIEIARSLQNYDGTFSSKFYETSGHTTDLNQRFNTTGHTMEFLSVALPENRLEEQWVKNAITALCNDLIVNRQRNIDCGPLYHTLNSLIIYRERLRSLNPGSEPTPPATAAGPSVAATNPVIPNVVRPNSQGVNAAPSALVNPNAAVVSKLPNSSATIEAKPVTTEKSLTPEVEKSPATSAEGATPPAATLPSNEALNELKLDGEFRARLNALSTRRTAPGVILEDSAARPLGCGGKAVVDEVDTPASALSPENR